MERKSEYLALAACCLVAAGRAFSAEGMGDPNSNVILVQAEVTRADVKGSGWLAASLVVRRVFLGEAADQGRSFSVRTTVSGEGGTGMLHPPPEQGEAGLWLLEETDTGHRPLFRPRFGVCWPVRERIDPRYGEAYALAEAIEKAKTATSEPERLRLLQAYALSTVPEISAWAIHAMAESRPAGVSDFLNKLAGNEQLSVAGQVALDEVLAQLRGRQWLTSGDRMSLLGRWASAEACEFDAGKIIGRFDIAHQRGELDDGALLGLLDTLVENVGLAVPRRRDALFLAGRTYRTTSDKDAVFSLLISQVKEAKEIELRHAAAYSLRNFVQLDDKQRALLAALKESTADHTLASILGEALQRGRPDGEGQKERGTAPGGIIDTDDERHSAPLN